MILLVVASLIVILGIGLAVKAITDANDTDLSITWAEFGISTAVISLIVVPLVVFVGWHMAVSNVVRYHEWWNGWEKDVLVADNRCQEDGSCRYTYDCDPYEVTDSSTDANGNTTYSSHTEYRSCPYATHEYTFFVDTTLGEFQIGGARFAENPVEWRGGSGLPDVPRGAPKLWKQAQARISAGDNGPVTKRADYDNYILASQSTILKRFSGSIKEYQKQHLLPVVVTTPTNTYLADKVYAEGVTLRGPWREAAMRLNSQLGSTLRGDLHVVVVKDAVDPDSYAGSLQAYWSSPALGKNDLSKNGIVLVLGTDGQTIKWSRAFTGMPLGNEAMLSDLRNLEGQPLDPKVLFGHATMAGSTDTGAVGAVLFGPHKFERVCMNCKSKGDHGVGFGYLKNEVQPTTGQRWLITILAVFISSIAWGVSLAVGTRPERR